MKNLNDKQKKVLGWVVLIVSFLWNTIYSFFIFIDVSLGEIFRYFYNDSFFGMLDSATYLFSDLEVWGWYFIISTIAFLIVYITYIVKSAKYLKENGLTKSLCQKVILFTFLYSVVQALPKIITMLEWIKRNKSDCDALYKKYMGLNFLSFIYWRNFFVYDIASSFLLWYNTQNGKNYTFGSRVNV